MNGDKVPKLLMLVISSETEPHRKNELAQRSTWANESFGVPLYWLHAAGTKGESSTCEVSPDFVKRRLDVKMPETYSGILEKTLHAIRWSLDNFDFDILIRTNTSSVWDEKLLNKLTLSLPTFRLYAGVVGHHKEIDDSWNYVNGAGLFMSRDIAELACTDSTKSYEHLVDDVAIGHLMRAHGVPIMAISRSDVTDHRPLFPEAHTRVKHWTYGSITRRRMRLLTRLQATKNPVGTYLALAKFDICELLTVGFDLRRTPRMALQTMSAITLSRRRRTQAFLSRAK